MAAIKAPPPADAPRGGEGTGAPRSGGDWRTYHRLLSYVRPYWPLFVLSVVGFLVGSSAEAFFVKLFGDLIDSWDETVATAAYTIPLLMLAAVVVRAVGEIAGELLLSQISFAVVHNVRTQLFDQLLRMPSTYFDASSQGHLVSRITYNVAQLRDTGTDALKSIIQDGGKVIVYLGYMLFLSWKLTLIFVATAPLVALVVMQASRRFRRISRRIQNSMGDVTHVTSEAVTGYRVVRIFGGESYEQGRFHRSSRYNRRQNLKMVATKVTSAQVIQIFVVAALALLIALLFRPEIGRELTTGQVVTFLGLAGMLANPIRKLSEVNARLQRGLAAAEDIFGQMDQPPEADHGTVDVERVEGRLEFRHLCFSYGGLASSGGPARHPPATADPAPDAPIPGDAAGARADPALQSTGGGTGGGVLDDISFTIEPGQTVAVVGRSGSGKSTLASLIPRFYEPTSGEILLDGRPLASYTLSSLRRQIALVTQQVTLFNDTLERNIAYGALEKADPRAIQEAVRRAHADVFIDELPDGLRTVVGDDGVLLSGGQRQRVAIARALLKDAPVLILDEATSALDVESERHIQAALEEVMRGRTTLVIAHRLSTIENADLILVMDHGRIVESGTHQELQDRGGAYAALYAAQFKDAARRAAEAPAGAAPPRRRRVMPGGAVATPSPVVRAWYGDAPWLRALGPLSWLFRRVASRRRMAYLTGARTPWRAPVPVIVVGNIAVGGTGKTPLVIWLTHWLKGLGFRPGIVSRGYRGRRGDEPLVVKPDTDPELAGDEAPLLAARAAVPVVVCADRVRAVQHLLEQAACDVVVSDDGLQHYALARDVELAVVDGSRGLGNGRCLPAGPLREPAERLDEVDLVLVNGVPAGQSSSGSNHSAEVYAEGLPEGLAEGLAERLAEGFAGTPVDRLIERLGACTVAVEPRAFVHLVTGERLGVDDFVARHEDVHAVAGIGNPARFADTLATLGLQAMLHAYPDHHRFSPEELVFADDWPVVCTEKDAVKLRRLEVLPGNCWYLEIDLSVPEATRARLLDVLQRHGIAKP